MVALNKSAIAVYEYLAEVSHGEPMSHAQIAQRLGKSVSTIGRAVKVLTETGHIVAIKGRHADSYKVSTDASGALLTRSLCHFADFPPRSSLSSIEFSSTTIEEVDRKEVDRKERDSAGELRKRWEPTPTPPVASGKRGPFSPDVTGLLAWFEYLVAQQGGNRITDKRRSSWQTSAVHLLAGHSRRPLVKIVEVLEWIFVTNGGRLPAEVKVGKNARVTNLEQVRWNFDAILDVMDGRPWVDSGTLLVQVGALVDVWKTRRATKTPTAGDVASWSKSFKIALTHRGVDFDTALRVAKVLADPSMEIDRGRYPTPFDMFRRDEWSHLVAQVEVAEQRAELRARALSAASKGQLWAGDLDDPRPVEGHRPSKSIGFSLSALTDEPQEPSERPAPRHHIEQAPNVASAPTRGAGIATRFDAGLPGTDSASLVDDIERLLTGGR